MEEDLKIDDRRRFPRFHCQYPILFMRYGDREVNSEGQGKTINISLGGLKVQTCEHVPVNEPVEFSLNLEGSTIRSIGRVIYKYLEADGQCNLGIAFEDISFENLNLLTEHFQKVLEK